ncbi:MAG: hypothetical protein ABIO76_11955, partial [Ginsengibacter sp.]
MKLYARLLTALFLIFNTVTSYAQDSSTSKIVRWTFNSVSKSGNERTISIKGIIQPGWKLFSTQMKDDEPNS